MPRADKGKKRKSYDSSKRKERALNRALRNVLDDEVRPIEGKPRSERRREHRESLLPNDRKCPLCSKIKLKSRQWVIVDELAICLSCHRST